MLVPGEIDVRKRILVDGSSSAQRRNADDLKVFVLMAKDAMEGPSVEELASELGIHHGYATGTFTVGGSEGTSLDERNSQGLEVATRHL